MPKLKILTNRASYELWHNRLGHPSQHVMENIHKYADGVPRLKHNDLWKCASCAQGKFRKKTHWPKTKVLTSASITQTTTTTSSS